MEAINYEGIEAVLLHNLSGMGVLVVLIIGWWRSRNDAKNAQTEQIKTLSAALQAALGSLEVMRARQDATEQALSRERESASADRIAQQNALDKLSDQMDGLRKENAQLKARVASLEAERDALRKERDALRKERDELNRDQAQMTTRIEELEREVMALKKKDTGPLEAPSDEPGEAAAETPEPKEGQE